MSDIDILPVAYILKNYCYYQKQDNSCEKCIFHSDISENSCILQTSPSNWKLEGIKT